MYPCLDTGPNGQKSFCYQRKTPTGLNGINCDLRAKYDHSKNINHASRNPPVAEMSTEMKPIFHFYPFLCCTENKLVSECNPKTTTVMQNPLSNIT